MASITSANAVFMLNIPNLFNAPQAMTNWATDDLYDADPLASAETLMGLDGHLSWGFVYTAQTIRFAFQADSPSLAVWEQLRAAEVAIIDKYPLSATISLPSLNRQYVLNIGVMSLYPAISNAKRTLAPRIFTTVWESIVGQPLQAVAA